MAFRLSILLVGEDGVRKGETAMKRFKGIYWRQFTVTAGMVVLTLVLLGTSFFALTYSYIMSENRSKLEDKAKVIAEKAEEYVREEITSAQAATPYDYQEALKSLNEKLIELVRTAQEMSDIDFLIWIPSRSGFISIDDQLAGKELTLPAAMGEKLAKGETYAGSSDLGLYDKPRFVVAIPGQEGIDGTVLAGPVLAIMEPTAMTEMWRAFLGIFGMTAITVLLIGFVATATTTMQQTKPINDMAIAARKFAQRREFIANISHELKTPMTTIAGYADGILDGVISPEEEKQYLRIISDESRRLSRLVRRMLDVSQLQSLDLIKQKKPFDLSESMRRVLVSMEKKITDRGLDVDVEIPDEPVRVLGDNDLLTQVVYNLLENAAKFAAPGSTLFLGLERRENKAVVTVRNTGETIPPEELPLLFERFHKTDKSRSEDKDGVGLGLYIVRTILEQHRETITATSENGVTTFAFTVQLAEENRMTKT